MAPNNHFNDEHYGRRFDTPRERADTPALPVHAAPKATPKKLRKGVQPRKPATKPLSYDYLNFTTDRKKKVTFAANIQGLWIPSHRDYDDECHRNTWTSCQEIKANAARNYNEYCFDKKDWRNATEEEGFMAWRGHNGVTHMVHPATYQALKEFEERRRQEEEEVLRRLRMCCDRKVRRTVSFDSVIDETEDLLDSEIDEDDFASDVVPNFGMTVQVLEY